MPGQGGKNTGAKGPSPVLKAYVYLHTGDYKGLQGLQGLQIKIPPLPPSRAPYLPRAPHVSGPVQVDYVKGWGKLKSATEVEVTGAGGVSTTVTAKSIIIATGSEVTPLPGVPVDERRCVVPDKGMGWAVG